MLLRDIRRQAAVDSYQFSVVSCQDGGVWCAKTRIRSNSRDLHLSRGR